MERRILFDYLMSIGEVDYKLKNNQFVEHLGVTFDPRLNFSHHIYEKTRKVTKILDILKRAFIFLDKNAFLLLYKSLIRLHFEYTNVCSNVC